MTTWPESVCAHGWIGAHATVRPDAPAIGTPDHGWTSYAGLEAAMLAAAASLAERGVGPGAIVVQALPPSATSVATGFAVQYLGATLVEVDRNLSADQLATIVDHTGAVVVIAQGRDAARWATVANLAAPPFLCIVHASAPPARMIDALGALEWIWLPTDPAELAAERREAPPGPAEVCPDDLALIVYTSGSTSAPRGVMQTHANIDANTRAIARYLDLTQDDRAMATLPLFYCYGRSVLQTHLLVGGSVFFDHRFMYPTVVLDEMAAQGCTGFAGVPVTFENLRRHGALEGRDVGALRYVTQAGGAMRADTTAWARQAFAPAELFVMYGQTEATARLTYLPPGAAAAKPGAVGVSLDNVELRIVDDAGRPVAARTDGHVLARGPSISPGYFRAVEATAEIRCGEWLRTGDVGHLDDDGFLFITGRAKEVLKLAGNRVSPVEIEELVASHPAIADVAVAGAIDSTGDEHAVAFVVMAADAVVDEAEVQRHVRCSAPAFKVPTRVRFVDTIPLTASGKVARNQLQESIKDDPHLLP